MARGEMVNGWRVPTQGGFWHKHVNEGLSVSVSHLLPPRYRNKVGRRTKSMLWFVWVNGTCANDKGFADADNAMAWAELCVLGL